MRFWRRSVECLIEPLKGASGPSQVPAAPSIVPVLFTPAASAALFAAWQSGLGCRSPPNRQVHHIGD